MNTSSTDAPDLQDRGPLQILNAPEIWVLLWSQSQNALHVERLQDMHRSNLEAFADNRRMDYVPLQIGSRDLIDAAANTVRPICHERSASHSYHQDAL